MNYFLRDSMKSGKLLNRCGGMVLLRGTAWPSLVIPISPTIGHILPKLALRQKSSVKMSQPSGRHHRRKKFRILDESRKVGARVVVTTSVPSNDSSDWIRLGQSHYYAFFLS